MRGLACLMVVAACQYEGGLVINVQPSDPTIDRVRLYVSTGEKTVDDLRPAHASELIHGVTYWPRDAMNELDHMLVGPGESARFVFVHTDADKLTAVIAVGYRGEEPVAVATRYNLEILSEAFIVHDVGLDTASSDLAVDPAVWIEPWSPSEDTPSSEAACIGVVDDTQKSFIVSRNDQDCDDYKTGSDEECDSAVYRQNRTARLDEMRCLATNTLHTSCTLGGPPCIDGELHDDAACRPSHYCALSSLCASCGENLACAQDITAVPGTTNRPTRIACTLPTQLVGGALCTQAIEVKLPGTDVPAKTVAISDPTHKFSNTIQIGNVTLEVKIDNLGRIALLPSGSFGARSEIGALIAAELSTGKGIAVPLTLTFSGGGGGGCTQAGICNVINSNASDSLSCGGTGWGPPVQAIVGEGRAPTLTQDLREIFYTVNDSGEVMTARRSSAISTWPPSSSVQELGLAGAAAEPELTHDGTGMYLSILRVPVGPNDFDIHTTTRTGTGQWTLPQWPMELINPGAELGATVDATERVMVYSADQNGSHDLYMRVRTVGNDMWSTPVLLNGLSSPTAEDVSPHLSPNGLTLYFSSNRMGTALGYELFVARRPMIGMSFGAPQHIAELSSPFDEKDPWVNSDDTVMFFSSNVSGDFHIYETRN